MPIVSVVFSFSSIMITILSVITQRKIYKSQEYIEITFDITGNAIANKSKYCKGRMRGIKQFLTITLGVDNNALELQKPMNIPNGLRIRSHIAGLFDKSAGNPMDKSWKLINESVNNGTLLNVVKDEWKLSSFVIIANIQCRFIDAVNNNGSKSKQIVQKWHKNTYDISTTILSDIVTMEMSAKRTMSAATEIHNTQKGYILLE